VSRAISSRKLATMAILATLYALLDQIPVSKLIGVSSALTMAEVFSPLAGMILGPFAGAGSVIIGTFEAFVFGRPFAFDGLDFLPAAAAALTAGLAIQKRWRSAAALSLSLAVIFSVDPFSTPFIMVGSLLVPYYWMQLLALGAFVAASYAQRAGYRFATAEVLVVATVFLSTLNAEVAGGIMYENVFVFTGVMSSAAVKGFWPVIFYVYPIERAFFTVAGSLLAVPVMKALPRSVLETLRGPAEEAHASS